MTSPLRARRTFWQFRPFTMGSRISRIDCEVRPRRTSLCRDANDSGTRCIVDRPFRLHASVGALPWRLKCVEAWCSARAAPEHRRGGRAFGYMVARRRPAPCAGSPTFRRNPRRSARTRLHPTCHLLLASPPIDEAVPQVTASAPRGRNLAAVDSSAGARGHS